jgi:histidinol dehydrogenase
VLPTSGAARRCSGLSVASFQTAITVQEATRGGLADRSQRGRLATAEGLDAHRLAVQLRLEAVAA